MHPRRSRKHSRPHPFRYYRRCLSRLARRALAALYACVAPVPPPPLPKPPTSPPPQALHSFLPLPEGISRNPHRLSAHPHVAS